MLIKLSYLDKETLNAFNSSSLLSKESKKSYSLNSSTNRFNLEPRFLLKDNVID